MTHPHKLYSVPPARFEPTRLYNLTGIWIAIALVAVLTASIDVLAAIGRALTGVL